MVKRSKKKRRDVEMSISSFSDIAFLLIIFFILATTLVQVTGVINEIPSGEQSQSEQDLESPTVKLERGRILFNDEPMDMQELRKQLADLKLRERSEDEKVVLLEASANVNYQAYFDVMANISAAGGVTAILQAEEE